MILELKEIFKRLNILFQRLRILENTTTEIPTPKILIYRKFLTVEEVKSGYVELFSAPNIFSYILPRSCYLRFTPFNTPYDATAITIAYNNPSQTTAFTGPDDILTGTTSIVTPLTNAFTGEIRLSGGGSAIRGAGLVYQHDGDAGIDGDGRVEIIIEYTIESSEL